MTISSEVRKAGPYNGNDVAVSFPFSFKVFSASDVVVVRADAVGAETTLVLTTDYTVALNADQDTTPGGTVSLPAALATGLTLTLTSGVAALQALDLTNQGGFYPKTINSALDKLTVLVQQALEQVSRALKVSVSSPLGATALPAPVANFVIGWNGTANGFKNFSPIDSGMLGPLLNYPSGASLVGYLPAGTGAVATTVQGKLRESVSVKDFGAVGDGVTDDTLAVQAALLAGAGRIVFFPAGTYLCTTIIVYSKTSMIGEGAGVTIIKAKSTLAGNAALLRNNITTGTIGVYDDTDILIEGIAFDGNGLGTRIAELVSCGKVYRLTVRDCIVRNVGYIGLAIGGCNQVSVLNCKFNATGNPIVTAEGGAALWIGGAGDLTVSKEVLVSHCNFENLEWSGIYANGSRIRISSCAFLLVKEAGIFQGAFTGLVVEGCTIVGVTRKNISASGIETGGLYITIVGNLISNVQNSNIALTNTQGVTISGNTLAECRQDAVTYPTASGIAIVTTLAAPYQPRNISITGNTFTSAATAAYAFVVIGNVGAAVDNISIQGNVANSSFVSGFGVFYEAGKRGNGCINRGNVGVADAAPVIKQITRDMTAASGAVATTGIGFRASKITLYAKNPGSIVQSIGVLTSTPSYAVIYTTSTAASDNVNNTQCVRLQTGATPDNQIATGVIDEDGFTLTWTKTGSPTGTATIVVVAEA